MRKITPEVARPRSARWQEAFRTLALAFVNACTLFASSMPAALGAPPLACPSGDTTAAASWHLAAPPRAGACAETADRDTSPSHAHAGALAGEGSPAGAGSPTGEGTLEGAGLPAGASTLKEADDAFSAGDHERALELYEKVLVADPDNLAALRRGGLLLGWAGRPAEAVLLLEHAVSLDPTHRQTREQLARVYSWNGKFDESLKQYDRLLDEDPSATATAIERARVLSWAGKLTASESAYRSILASDPDNTEATLGLAQCLGWQGRLDESASLYRAVLPKDPMTARIGLGRVSLWRGDAAEALRAASAALATDPNNKEALDLRKDALRRTRPSLALTSEVSSDTDRNRNVAAGFVASFHPNGILDIDVSFTRTNERGFDLAAERFAGLDLTGDGSVDVTGRDEIHDLATTVIGGTVGFRAGSRGRISLGAAAERLGQFDRPAPLTQRSEQTELSGSLYYRLTGSPVSMRVGVVSEVPKWTAFITQSDLRWNHAELGLEGSLPWKARWATSVDGGRITGGAIDNGKRLGLARAWREFDLGGPTLTPRLAVRYMAYDHNLLDGYFDPQSYVSGTVGADLGGSFAAHKLSWGFSADTGIERFRFDAEEIEVCDFLEVASGRAQCVGLLQDASKSGNNTTVAVAGRLSWAVRENLSFEATASWNDSAAQSASGFTSRTFGLSARIGF